MANLSTHDWLELSQEVRSKLVKIFNIPRSSTGHVEYHGSGAVQTSDGYTHEDLKAISVEAMQNYTLIDTNDFGVLFEGTLSKLSGVPQPEPVVVTPTQTQEQTVESCISKVKEIKLEAEEKGLIKELVNVFKKEFKVKK